jgi:hypothetical protein
MANPRAPNSELSDAEFIRRYEARSLQEFSHHDHLRMAFIYARGGGVADAIQGARGIRGFAQALGE